MLNSHALLSLSYHRRNDCFWDLIGSCKLFCFYLIAHYMEGEGEEVGPSIFSCETMSSGKRRKQERQPDEVQEKWWICFFYCVVQ